MAQFMLILHDRPKDFTALSAEEMQTVIAEYSAWREELAAAGRLVGGQKLADEGGRVLRRRDDGAISVVDGPYSEAKEVVGGYFAIEAADYDEAVEIARGCPHLTYGERIELRQIDRVAE